MSFSGSKLREAAQKREQKRKSQKTATLLGGSVLVIFIIIALWASNVEASKPANHFVEYDSSLVVYDQPMQAIHEMNAPSSPANLLTEGGPQPSIVIEQDFFDFKKVGATEVVQHEFVLTNEGDAPLVITSAFTTCACTTADFSGTIIPPGKIAIVTLTFDAGYHDARGQTVRRGLIMQTNDPMNPQVEVWTQAAVSMTP